MRRKTKKYGFLFGLCLLGLDFISYAQEVSFTGQAPGVVRAGEQFQLVYTADESVDDFTPPNFGEFRYLAGPNTGSSTSISIVNGRTTRTSTYSFTYYLQAPADGGKYTLGPATATFKRKQINSNSITIEVVAPGGSPSQTAKSKSEGTADQGGSAGSGEDIYVRLEFDKRTAYVGEQITAWVKLYTQASISGIDQQFKGPDFIGFYQQNVELPPLTSLDRERVGDDIYYTGIIRKVILTPQKHGEITIQPFDLLVEVQKQTRRRPQSIFDEFFNSPFERVRMNLRSNQVKLTIRPLPPDQPADFSGAVGTFQINGSTNLTEVTTNDAITFRIDVGGKGNIKLIDKLSTGFPPAFDVFDPVKKVQMDAGSQGRSGKVTFEYTAIPRHAGKYTIPAFSLVYFDPDMKSYRTISTQTFDINVFKGEGDSTSIVAGNLSKEEIELLGSDIRYIATTTNLVTKGVYIFGSKWFYGIYSISLLVFLFILFLRRRQIQRNANLARYRNRKAGKTATKRLKKARKFLKLSENTGFYDELEQALWGYLADKLNIPYSELSKEKIITDFKRMRVSEEISNDLFTLLDKCQLARYAPGGITEKMSDIYREASSIIGKLDQKL